MKTAMGMKPLGFSENIRTTIEDEDYHNYGGWAFYPTYMVELKNVLRVRANTLWYVCPVQQYIRDLIRQDAATAVNGHPTQAMPYRSTFKRED